MSASSACAGDDDKSVITSISTVFTLEVTWILRVAISHKYDGRNNRCSPIYRTDCKILDMQSPFILWWPQYSILVLHCKILDIVVCKLYTIQVYIYDRNICNILEVRFSNIQHTFVGFAVYQVDSCIVRL